MKSYWECLQDVYFGLENVTPLYDVCKQYFGLEQGNQSLTKYYSQIMHVLQERNMYQSLTTGITRMEMQRQDMDVVRFLSGLKSEYELVRAQILCSSILPCHHEVYS